MTERRNLFCRVCFALISIVLCILFLCGTAVADDNARDKTTQEPVTGGNLFEMRTDHCAYISGVPGGYFEPDREVTRAEAATMLSRLNANEISLPEDYTSPYLDVHKGLWYANSVFELYEAHAFSHEEAYFRGSDSMTRGEFVDMLVKAMRVGAGGSGDGRFTDCKGHKYETSIETARLLGWAAGYGNGKFGPDDTLTRAQAVTFLNRVQGRGPLNFETVTDSGKMFKDNMDMSAWYYYDIIEAATSHEYVITDEGYEYWTSVTGVGKSEAIQNAA